MRTYYMRHKTGLETLITAVNANAAHQSAKAMLRSHDLSTDVQDWQFTRVDNLLDIQVE